MPHFPLWLHWLSIASISLGVLCALVIAFDETRRPQSMWVMNCVWPLTALYAGIFGLAFYWRWSRTKAHHAMAGMGAQHPSAIRHSAKEPWSVSVAKATTHCGAGCTLGDIIAEWTAFLFPAVAVAFGWESLFAEKMFAVWVLDFLLAFLFGILFQYFTIQPMRHLSFKDGLVAALKADTASITAWQIGMYGMMAVAQFLWFSKAYGAPASADYPEFWFVMQLAMLCGFVTSFPANALLIKFGLKEAM